MLTKKNTVEQIIALAKDYNLPQSLVFQIAALTDEQRSGVRKLVAYDNPSALERARFAVSDMQRDLRQKVAEEQKIRNDGSMWMSFIICLTEEMFSISKSATIEYLISTEHNVDPGTAATCYGRVARKNVCDKKAQIALFCDDGIYADDMDSIRFVFSQTYGA